MFKLYTVIFVFALLQNVKAELSDSCLTFCAADTTCLVQEAAVEFVDPTALAEGKYQRVTKTKGKSTCEEEEIRNVIGTDTDCQSASATFDVDVPIDCSTDPITTYPFPSFLSIDVDFGSTAFESANCQTNDGLSAAMTQLIGCVLTDDFVEYVGCNYALPEECEDWLNVTIEAYPECACNAIFDHVGVAGYAFIPTINNWIQTYLGTVINALDMCQGSIVDIDCTGLIPNCEVNNELLLNICDEVSLIPADASGFVEVQISACASHIPGKFKRSDLWRDLKKGLQMQFSAEGVTMDFDAYVVSSHVGRRGSKDSLEITAFPVDISCDKDAKTRVVAIRLRLIYEEFEDLVNLVKVWWEHVDDFAAGLASNIVDLTIPNDEDGIGFTLKADSFLLEFELYSVDADGNVVQVEVDTTSVYSGAVQPEFYAIFVVFVVAIMASN